MTKAPVWRGHEFPTTTEDVRSIRDQLHEVIDHGIDVLLVMRASALPPELIREARARGVFVVVWLPDDPVLYDILYRHIVDEYDLVLHCGPERVLEFYDSKGHQPGINFPFWTSTDFFPYCYQPQQAKMDLVFWGNCTGGGRSSRYETIAALPARSRIYGRVDEDSNNLHGGIVKDVNNDQRLVSKTFANFKLGLNIPQLFSKYCGSPYDFPGLKKLGEFQVPSRVVQYAASGLPIISFGKSLETIFPGAICVEDMDQATRALEVVQDVDRLLEISRTTHRTFVRHYSAQERARFLLELIRGESGSCHGMDVETRATLFYGPKESTSPYLGEKKPKKITISGYYGRANFGDELILASLIENIKAMNLPLEISVAAENPRQVEQVHSIRSFSRHDLNRASAEAKDSSAIILGGGGLWHDYSFDPESGNTSLFSDSPWSITGYAKLPILWKINEKALHFFGLGVGPLSSPDAKAFLRFMSELATTITVRDNASHDLLRNISGWEKGVNVYPDPFFALNLEPYLDGQEQTQTKEIRIGINLRKWPYGNHDAFIDNLTGAMTQLAGKHPISLVGIPLQESSDREAIETFFERIPKSVERDILDENASHSEIVQAIAGNKVMVSMRLHASMLAWRLGVPSVGISYDPKVALFFDQICMSGLCLSLESTESSILEKTTSAIENAQLLISQASNAIERLEQQSLKGFAFLKQWLVHG